MDSFRSHEALNPMRVITGAPLALNICPCGWLGLDKWSLTPSRSMTCRLLSTSLLPSLSGIWTLDLYPGESHKHIRCKLLIVDLDLEWRLVRCALLLLGQSCRSYCHRVRWTESVDHQKSPFCVTENPRHYLSCYHVDRCLLCQSPGRRSMH